ncbi:uncharacterized protein PpBr36_06097, partial [Pyricularia pennisetigena]|uniref:uncharacterized protein n=1 Tax=Pyricularia pennisetigena TaxID=1578925 RepID=UPI001150277C
DHVGAHPCLYRWICSTVLQRAAIPASFAEDSAAESKVGSILPTNVAPEQRTHLHWIGRHLQIPSALHHG